VRQFDDSGGRVIMLDRSSDRRDRDSNAPRSRIDSHRRERLAIDLEDRCAHAVIFNAASFRSKKRLTILIVSPLNL